MRRVRHILCVVVGQASFACLITATPAVSFPWSSAPATENTDDNSQPTANGQMVDPAVQQANFYGPDYPTARPSAPKMSTHRIPGAPAAPPKRKGPLFGGQAVKLPTLPFGRTATASNAKAPANGMMPSNVAQNNQNAMQQRATVRQPAPINRPNQRMMGNSSAAANQAPQNVRVAGAASMQRTRQAMPPEPNGYPAQAATMRPMPMPMPQQNATAQRLQAPMAASHMTAGPIQSSMPANDGRRIPAARSAAPAAEAPAAPKMITTPNASPMPSEAAAPPKIAATSSPADKLVMQAHELTTTAHTEVDFTRIIETCRRARASQASPAATQYANNLAAWAFNRRGQIKAEAGRDKEAMLDFDDAVRTDPQRWRAMHNRGVLFAQAGEFEKAFDDFNRTIELSPNFAKAYCNRAALFMVAGELPAAAKDYSRAIELDPNLAVAHRGRARVCHLLGRLDEAADHYDAAVQLAPTDAYAVASRADLMTDMGRYADAAAGYDEAIRLQPKSCQPYSSSAWLLSTCPDSSVRNPELAIERAKKAMELSGKEDAVGLDTLAAAQACAGQFDAAAQSVGKALKLAPADERSVYQERLELYEHGKAYRIAPVQLVSQANYESAEGADSGE